MKKAIVIGSTSGIGKGLAKIFAANNYNVGITGRRKELLLELNDEHPDVFKLKVLDVTDTASTIQHLEALTAELGGLDLLVISSGIGEINETLDFEIEKQTIATNIIGFTCIADWTYTYFEKQKAGHLVVISSVGGIRGSRHAPAYNATKAYQINYTEGLRQKAAKQKLPIFITDIRPGLVDTKMAKGEGLFWVAPVEKAAQQIFTAIKRKRKVVYITKRWRMIGFLLKIMPYSLLRKM